MNRAPAAADAVPGLLPHQQRHLHRHQRPGRPGAGAERVDGDAAGHRLRRRRRAVRRAGRRATSAPGAAGARSSSGCVVAIAIDRAVRLGRVASQFWLLVAGATLAGYYNANAGLYRFAATELVEPTFKERAISWVLAGGILGAVAGPNLARVDARRCCRPSSPAPMPRWPASRCCSLATISLIRFPPLVAAERRRARPAAARDRARSRCSSSPSAPARSATA